MPSCGSGQFALESVLTQIAEMRGARRSLPQTTLIRLDRLLGTECVELPRPPGAGLPKLTDGPAPTITLTIEEALRRMSEDYEVVARVVAAVADVWGERTERLHRLAGEVKELEQRLPRPGCAAAERAADDRTGRGRDRAGRAGRSHGTEPDIGRGIAGSGNASPGLTGGDPAGARGAARRPGGGRGEHRRRESGHGGRPGGTRPGGPEDPRTRRDVGRPGAVGAGVRPLGAGRGVGPPARRDRLLFSARSPGRGPDGRGHAPCRNGRLRDPGPRSSCAACSRRTRPRRRPSAWPRTSSWGSSSRRHVRRSTRRHVTSGERNNASWSTRGRSEPDRGEGRDGVHATRLRRVDRRRLLQRLRVSPESSGVAAGLRRCLRRTATRGRRAAGTVRADRLQRDDRGRRLLRPLWPRPAWRLRAHCGRSGVAHVGHTARR